MKTTDKIEKQVDIAATTARVWRALTDQREFETWFGVKLAGPFVVGAAVKGDFGDAVPPKEKLDEIQKKAGIAPAEIQMPPPHSTFCVVEKMEKERLFSFRWIPFGIDASADLSNEPMTLVEFVLEQRGNGTRLTITESGFDRVPAHRRARAFLMNDGGWAAQAQNVKAHVEKNVEPLEQSEQQGKESHVQSR